MKILVNARNEREFNLFHEIFVSLNPLMNDDEPTFDVKRKNQGDPAVIVFESNKWTPLDECEASVFDVATHWLLMIDSILASPNITLFDKKPATISA